MPGADISAQLDVLRQRMESRADPTTDIARRLQRARDIELPYQSQCDHIVVNDDLASAIEATRRIIEGELAARGLLEATT